MIINSSNQSTHREVVERQVCDQSYHLNTNKLAPPSSSQPPLLAHSLRKSLIIQVWSWLQHTISAIVYIKQQQIVKHANHNPCHGPPCHWQKTTLQHNIERFIFISKNSPFRIKWCWIYVEVELHFVRLAMF